MKWMLALLLFLNASVATADAPDVDHLAQQYLHLALAMGAHDKDYVDAYYGPPEIQAEVKEDAPSLEEIKIGARDVLRGLVALAPAKPGSMQQLRLQFLQKQTIAMLARIDVLQGVKLGFDEESSRLYDTVAPKYERAHFEAIIRQIDALLPGPGSTAERVNAFRAKFVIPPDKLKPVFEAAIRGCRERTLAHIALPEGEDFRLEFVSGKPWSAYNWYQGNFKSLIQVNTELPIQIERAIDLGCHEGYPGHHAYNVLLEQNLVRQRKWQEFSVYPLFSPLSLIAEGSANYGIEIAFPEAERRAFLREVLYPLAGLDPAQLETYEALLKLTGQLGHAGNVAAREYLDGRMTRAQAIQWALDVELSTPAKAEQRMKFVDTYRSYVINYNVGKDLVRDYIDALSRHGATEAERGRLRWQAFTRLLSSPRLPGDLRAEIAASAAPPAASIAPAAPTAPAALPAGTWNGAQRRAVLDSTRTLRLAPDLSSLRAGEKAALGHLLAAGKIVQSLYERQLHPQAAQALARVEAMPAGAERTELLQLYRLFKGPIATTLDNTREPFLPVAPAQASMGVYPSGLTRQQLDAFLAAHPAQRAALLDPLSVVRRGDRAQLRADLAALDRHPALDLLHPGLRARLQALLAKPDRSVLYALPYSVAWADDTVAIYRHLQAAADAVAGDDAEFARYLRARARDLLSDDYEAGDAAWVTGRFQRLNAQIGAYETYDDPLLGVRAFYSLSVMLRRAAESDAVAAALGDLQGIHDALPLKVERRVRSELPVGVYEVIADFGQARGGNTATILPNDTLHSRRYGRTIMMRDNLVRHPEAATQARQTWAAAIVPAQHADLVPDANVQRTLWHEIGHYLGVDRTSDGRDLDQALQGSADLLEEMKSDLVALDAVPRLQATGYYTLDQAHAVYASGILRTLQRNQPRREQPYNTMQLMQWNWFLARGVLRFDPLTQRMQVDYARYPDAVHALLAEVLKLQAAGDAARAEAFVREWTKWDPALHEVIARRIRESLQYRYAQYTYGALGE